MWLHWSVVDIKLVVAISTTLASFILLQARNQTLLKGGSKPGMVTQMNSKWGALFCEKHFQHVYFITAWTFHYCMDLCYLHVELSYLYLQLAMQFIAKTFSSQKPAKIGGSSEPLEPPLVTGLYYCAIKAIFVMIFSFPDTYRELF